MGPTSSSSSSGWQDVDETWTIVPLYLVRLADDIERIEIIAERYQKRVFKVVEIPNDYATRLDPTEPVFLYKFTAALPDGDVVWRFTSHPTDVTLEEVSSSSSSGTVSSVSSDSSSQSLSSVSSGDVSTASSSSSSSLSSNSSSSSESSSSGGKSSSSGSTPSSSSSSGPASQTLWLAVGIDHGRLSRSTKFGGTVEVTGDYDTVEPLRLCVPLRIDAPLKLEILKTDTDLGEPETIFNGSVRNPRLRGRTVSVSCVEWGDALEGKVPNFFIQRVCNYRIYESGTCKAVQSSFQVAVTITAVSSRSITITGAGLAGLAEGYFSEGWIETGSGLDRRVGYITDSEAASGTTVVLTVSQTLSIELPASATAVPGCDGQRATCISKFNNLDNYGGHETPRTNLSVEAIKTDQSGTGGFSS